MTFIQDIRGVVSTNNSNSALNQSAFNSDSGTAQAGSLTSITLRSGASAVDSFYNNLIVEIVGGTGVGQKTLITAYVGATKVATATFKIAPDSTSIYVVHNHSGQCQEQNQSNTFKTIRLASGASTSDDFYNQAFIKIFTGLLDESVFRIVDYDGTTQVATVSTETEISITSNTLYAIFGEGGTAVSGTANTIVLQAAHGHSSTDDFYNGLRIDIYAGTGVGQSREISDYVGATRTVTVSSNWDTNPDNTSQYIIYGGWSGSLEEIRQYSETTTSLVTGTNEEVILDFHLSLTSTGSEERTKFIQSTPQLPSSVHTLVVVSRYFCLRLVGMGTSITGNVQTILHNTKNKDLTSTLEEKINSQNDCQLTRSVLVGRTSKKSYKNIGITNTGNLSTTIRNPIAPFGSLKTVELTPISQNSYIYRLNGLLQTLDSGTSINMITEGTGGTAQVQTITVPQGSQYTSSGAADYFFLYAGGGGQFYVWFDVDNGNTDPAPGGTGIEVDIGAADSAVDVGSALQSAVDGNANFSATVLVGNVIQITNSAVGDTTSIQPATMPTTSGSSITHDSENSMVVLNNAAGIGYFAVTRSERSIRYRPGQGVVGRLTAIFDSPSAGSSQIAGLGNQVSGLFFGYNGTDFGILHRSTGQPEIRTLTINSAATSSGTVIITVDGIDFPVAVTSGTANENAYEIGSANYRFGSWLADPIGNTIVFLSETATGPRNNTYGFNANGVTGITASFSTTSTGSAIVNTWIQQEDWNMDKLDGTGDSSMVLDPTRGNVYEIAFEWLGFGKMTFSIEDDETGDLIPVHEIKYTNRNTVPSMTLPHLRILLATFNETGTQSKTLRSASSALFVTGKVINLDPVFSNSVTNIVTTDNTEGTVLILRNPLTFNGKGNNVEIRFLLFNIVNDAARPGIVRLYRNATFSENIFEYFDENESAALFDTTTTVTPTGGNLIGAFVAPRDTNVTIDIDKLNLVIHNSETLTFTVQRIVNNVDISFSFSWTEDQ